MAARVALMTPVQFEQSYGADWDELERLLAAVRGKRKERRLTQGERVAALYRCVCEQLALARARSYPAYLVDRLERLSSDAHQAIYQQRDIGLRRMRALAARDFPRAVRAHAAYVWLAAAVFVLPIIVVGLIVHARPELILSVVDAETAAEFERMYSGADEAIGRTRGAETDLAMFGYYIRHNVGLAFQCFASGLLAGVGSLFFLAYNGVFFGALAGYLTERGLSETFYSFVVTHAPRSSSTAIVLAGAAGLRIGHSLLMPGRLSRKQALVTASREAIVIVYGVAVMLLVAAAIEAFWSSAVWVPPTTKYSVAAGCWIAVIGYLTLQGRNAR